MTDLEEKEIVAQVVKKIDQSSVLTRLVVVICCLTVLASMFYTLTSLVQVLPEIVVAKVIGNVDLLRREWHALDKLEVLREQAKLKEKEKEKK